MVGEEKDKLLKEAADIFLRLSENPEDPQARKLQEHFVARGEAERAAYEKILRAWKATGSPKKSTKLYTIVLALAFTASIIFGVPEFRTYWLTDYSTRLRSEAFVLASGDKVNLDASSALADQTEVGDRNVELLQGAAFFDVRRNERPFIVTLDNYLVEVTGTKFETAFLDDHFKVSVLEGSVKVRVEDQTYHLESGQQLVWSDPGKSELREVGYNNIASWRKNRVFAQNTPLADLAEIIGRRLSGDVIVWGKDLGELQITASFDLDQPEIALATLAAAGNAQVISIRPLTTLIVPR